MQFPPTHVSAHLNSAHDSLHAVELSADNALEIYCNISDEVFNIFNHRSILKSIWIMLMRRKSLLCKTERKAVRLIKSNK